MFSDPLMMSARGEKGIEWGEVHHVFVTPAPSFYMYVPVAMSPWTQRKVGKGTW